MAARGADDTLIAFAFESWLRSSLPIAVLVRLERQCWAFNMRHGLTGEMRLENDFLWQTVEGPVEIVAPLAARILGDPRHHRIAVRTFGGIHRRAFADWRSSGFDFDHLDTEFRPAALADLGHAWPQGAHHRMRVVASGAALR